MLFLVLALAAWAAAQSTPFVNFSSALSGQSQLSNLTTYLGLFATLVSQIEAGNTTGMPFRDKKDICALMEADESLSTFR